jgi:hypothetical protein
MEGLQPLDGHEGVADLYVHGQPMQITHARTYFRLKHIAAWFALCPNQLGPGPIRLHVWDTWDTLALRVEARLGTYLWHPSHWETYYATLPDTPTSAPGATPRTMAILRAALKVEQESEVREQYALFA